MRFATVGTISHLLEIFTAPSSQLIRTVLPQNHTPTFLESLRQSAAVALQHICRLNPQLFHSVFTTLTPAVYFNTLVEDQPRVQQAFITMLNWVLHSNSCPTLMDLLLAEESFLPSLLRLHEHASIVIRGKCLLTFLMLFKQDFRWLSVAH